MSDKMRPTAQDLSDRELADEVEAVCANNCVDDEEKILLEAARRLREHVCDLSDSIKEALNSGDGTYRP